MRPVQGMHPQKHVPQDQIVKRRNWLTVVASDFRSFCGAWLLLRLLGNFRWAFHESRGGFLYDRWHLHCIKVSAPTTRRPVRHSPDILAR